MTAPSINDTSVGTWMLPASGESRVRIEQVVTQTTANRESARPLRTLGVVARHALAQEIEAKLRAVLSETLAALIIEGWHTYGAITEAIKKSRVQLGVAQIVPLRTHVINADREHNVDIEIDSFPVMSLTAKASVKLQLFAAVAVVLDGHVVEIRSGQATADGWLSVDGVEISRKSLALPLEARLILQRPPQAVVAAG